MCPYWRELQISIVIGHMVEHVSHGNHHGRAGRLLLLFLIVIVMILFLWLLKTREDGGRVTYDGGGQRLRYL